jgi:RNA polymerase sigma-70 factor (ECF subfamily)
LSLRAGFQQNYSSQGNLVPYIVVLEGQSTKMENENLVKILDACCRQDLYGQKELYRQFYGYAMSVTLRYAGNEEDAIELANDAFLKVFLNVRQFDKSKPFKPWFRRILVNTAINYIKKKQQIRMQPLSQSALDIPDTDEILARIGFDELMAIVQRLTAAYRAVFNMYVVEGFTHEEIAAQLGISVGTSKSNLSKARANLRQIVLTQLEIG